MSCGVFHPEKRVQCGFIPSLLSFRMDVMLFGAAVP